MPNKPLLSVAIVVHNQRDVIEATLTSLYELNDIPIELFLIDDGSTDGSKDAIESLLDYHQHEQTFYYSHSKPVGRGNSLNEAILQCNAPLFWAPETIGSINEKQLAQQLRRLLDSDSAALTQSYNLPSTHRQWVDLILEDRWLTDGEFIWNLPVISPANHFFNPYLQQHHGIELAARLGDISSLNSPDHWYTPSSFIDLPKPNSYSQQELLITILRRADISGVVHGELLDKLNTLSDKSKTTPTESFDNELLAEALQMKKDGRFNSALELIEEVLESEPSHQKAQQLKIEILEKKRRFVEASELKHEVNRSQVSEPEETDEPSRAEESKEEGIELSLIIPTTTHGKPALEHCLLSISEHCSKSGVELIVVDNASLDDTHDYLDELKEKNFLNCKVITNNKNIGFAASVNQGIDKANGRYACIIHNDVEFNSDSLLQLKKLMDAHPDFAILGPSTNKTLNPEQAKRNVEDSDPKLVRTEYLDSFCMMIRLDTELKMDEQFQLAFFEDIDICFQARKKGHKVGIAPHVSVEHHFGTTTFSLDLDTESEQYWRNVSYFNEKWDVEVFSKEELKSLSTFDQLLALDDLVNPLFPEEEIQKQFQELFTDELKTEILKTSHDAETLCKLVHLFMVMDEREIMRRLEDRLDDIELPASLIYQLVRFYYNRNIYSRCTHYLSQLKPQNESLRADLYQLAINVENKDLDQAIPLLKELMKHTPANPMLYKLAGDIHKFSGNQDEASSFYDLAEQINPFEFTNEEKDAFGFKL
ncbi:glycosyltransferase [Fodinibius halophilus]|uniref:Glycosyltransferase n=1 Tax=Fodinibius halophilus TaxID=1736908 RepID=A0A6M1SUS7_9BACT|nr:glycosyltransferase [Fodinibius halophilus]NGP87326.1 glycosyltransferase [Fodinibius halophilus]